MIKEINHNLIDTMDQKIKIKQFFKLMINVVGEKKSIKINRIKRYLKKTKSDYLLVTAPENVAWTLNIRGNDNPNSPIPNCNLFISKKKKIFLISDKSKLKI